MKGKKGPVPEMKVIAEDGVTVKQECFLHGEYDGTECQQCVREQAEADIARQGEAK